MKPFWDSGLDERVREARQQWETEAQQVLTEQVGEEQIEQIRTEAEEALEEVRDQVANLEAALAVDEIDGVELPEPPEIIYGDVPADNGKPLIDSDREWAEQTRQLIAHKAYENGSA
jgi:hypothetical protein